MDVKAHLIIIDAHVHIHDCFNLTNFLDSAYENCKAEICRLGKGDQFMGVLFLTETSRDHWFQRLVSYTDKKKTSSGNHTCQWSFHRTGENNSLLAQSASGGELVLIAGRQIVTKENLEVLALATDSVFNDGVSIRDAIEIVRERGAIPVIPWGFGKWWGRRGKVLTEVLQSQKGTNLFLGDTSSRPGFLPYPTHFKQAKKQGMRILSGSDPLPLASEFWRPCSIGFSVIGLIEKDTPATDLKRILRDPTSVFSPYNASRENWYRFFSNQVGMQLIKAHVRNDGLKMKAIRPGGPQPK